MSSFYQTTKHPLTGEFQTALWIDDHFGRHRYGVRFADGWTFRESEIEAVDQEIAAENNTGESR